MHQSHPDPHHDDDRDITLSQPREILKLITASALADSAVEVVLEDHYTPYISRFALSADSFEALEQGAWLELQPLDPPVGNLRIRHSPRVRLHFFTSEFNARADTEFLEIGTNHGVRLRIPTRLHLTHQKRETVRLPVLPEWGITLKIIRPSGLSFLARLMDLSAGGMRFAPLGLVAHIAERANLEVLVTWPQQSLTLRAAAQMLKPLEVDGEVVFRVRFSPRVLAESQAVEEFAARVQREHLRRRSELFDS
ncbi:MAG: hypothetical protein H7831_15850 [Magnetococcus sp. WYHC-3]